MRVVLSKEEIKNRLRAESYITEPSVTMALFLALRLEKPLLVEGPAGVGKTEISKALATLLQTELIRLQCYEGIDVSQAIYEWNYQHQLMYLKLQEIRGSTSEISESDLYDERFLLQRPILKSIMSQEQTVLLIDEVDRADEAFESFLLEVLSDWQVSIPELGTLKAVSKPAVILTSNATRELSEALRRRCIYLYIDYPDFAKEMQIVGLKVPEIDEQLTTQVCHFMEELRKMTLRKQPGVAETLDWARSLAEMHITRLDRDLVSSTLGMLLKDWRDQKEVGLSLAELLEKTNVQARL